jgi:hypothetical protein
MRRGRKLLSEEEKGTMLLNFLLLSLQSLAYGKMTTKLLRSYTTTGFLATSSMEIWGCGMRMGVIDILGEMMTCSGLVVNKIKARSSLPN